MSSNRPRLKQLFKLVEDHAITKVIVEHKDRLTRFNFGVYERFFLSHGVTIEWVDSNKSKTYEEELVDDMISLMSSFSSKIYGKRSAENRKKRKLEKLTKMGAELVENKIGKKSLIKKTIVDPGQVSPDKLNGE
jgi:predicted site-specific integrase-resolvase